MKITTQNAKTFIEGQRASLQFKEITDNPYSDNSSQAQQWQEGFEEMQELQSKRDYHLFIEENLF